MGASAGYEGVKRDGHTALSLIREMMYIESTGKQSIAGVPCVVVVLEFPSMQHARDWYNDPEYAPLIALRQTGSDLDFMLVEGV